MLLLCNVIIAIPCSNIIYVLINSRLQKWNFNLFSSYYSLNINFQSIFLAIMSIPYFARFQIKQTPFKEKERKMVYAKPTILCSLKAVMQQLECYKKQSNNINFLLLLHHHLKCNEAVCKNARDLRLLFLHSTKIMLVEFFHMLQFNDILINILLPKRIVVKSVQNILYIS